MRLILLSIFLISFLCSSGQSKWTFKQCVDYAFDNNLALKKQYNSEKRAAYNLSESKWQIAPRFSAGSNLSLDLRRSTNQNNQISSGQSYSSRMYLNGSLSLFNGLVTLNDIKAKKILQYSQAEKTEQLRNNLFLDILTSYSRIVFEKEKISVAEKKLAESETQLDNIKVLVEVGKRASTAIDEMNATVSGAKLDLAQAVNSLAITKIELAHLLEYSGTDKLDIFVSDFSEMVLLDKKYDSDEVYRMACNKLPQIKEQELQQQYLEKILAIQYGQFSPSLSASGGYGTGYYSTDTLENGLKTPFNKQFGDYLNPSVGMSLSIPIFNGRRREYNVKRTKLYIEDQLYTLQQQKNTIKREIEEAIQIFENSKLEFINASDYFGFVKKSYQSNKEKYELGLINSTDYIIAQNQMVSAQLNVINAKLNWIAQEKVIKLYMGMRDF